jgi:polysaccharide biosynthesis transport protein
MPGLAFDLIPAGLAQIGPVDADSAAMVLDALDEVYDFIVVHGAYDVAHDLFETLEGRFDAGVVVADKAHQEQSSAGLTHFLGFEVPDFLVATLSATVKPGNTRLRENRLQGRGKASSEVAA